MPAISFAQKQRLISNLQGFGQDTGNPVRHVNSLRKLAEGYPVDALDLRGTYPLLESSGIWHRTTGFPHGTKKIIRKFFGITTLVNPWVARLDVLSPQKLYVLFRVADHPFVEGEFSQQNAGGFSASRSQLHTQKMLLDKTPGKRGSFSLKAEVAEVWPAWKERNAQKLQDVIKRYAPNGLPKPDLEEKDSGPLLQATHPLSLMDLSLPNRELYQLISLGQRKMVLGMLEPNDDGVMHSVQQLNLIAGNYMEICVRRQCEVMGVAA